MNGGRLSDDEAFALGMGELRAHLAHPTFDLTPLERACHRIAVRYPEEADRIWQALTEGNHGACAAMLSAVEAQYKSDCEED